MLATVISDIINCFVFFGLLLAIGIPLQLMKWKYDAGARQRDFGMFKTGAGMARIFMGK